MKALLCFVILMSSPAFSFRYLCNSIDAEGNVWGDSYNNQLGCTASSAPRWSDANLRFYVDTQGLPPGISAETWVSFVQEILQSWQAIPNTSLLLETSLGSKRSFGTDPTSHDLFWVSDRDEWIDLIGVGPEGILGVTLPVYSVAKGSSVRILEDADMILNGCKELGVPWNPNCTNPDLCFPPQATFSHEFGHVLGLGHPCVACNQLMSAQAVTIVEQPGFDEHAAIRMLYPGTTPGVLGDSCLNDSSCQLGLECRSDSDQQYCSKSCAEDSDCSDSLMVCGLSGFCSFESKSDNLANLAEDCSLRRCGVGLLCVTNQSGSSLCYTDCSAVDNCMDTETCHALKDGQGNPANESACIQTDSLVSTGGSASPAKGVDESSGCNASSKSSQLWFFALILLLAVPRTRKKC